VVKAEMKAVAKKKKSCFNLVKIETFRVNSGCGKQQRPISGAEERTRRCTALVTGRVTGFYSEVTSAKT